MSSGWIAEFIESVTAPGTPIDDIKKANEKFEDMWYDEGTLSEDATKKDYYDQLAKINSYELQWGRADKGLKEQSRKNLLADLNKAYPDRAAADYLGELKSQKRSPHWEKGRPFEESDVTEAILEGALKKPEAPYTGPFGKLGEHFSKNAAARDKLFQYIGSMGKEFVKPIEPGKEAAGALLPTLSRGITKGEEEYASKQAAATKRMLDMAEAQQKINPLQYFSTKMKEAKAMVPEGIEPGSAAEKKWIANYLRSTGIPSQLVDLTASVESLNLQLMTAPNDERKKELQAMIDGINKQILDLASQGMGGGTTGINIPYMP
jgi:hypothetical protein